MAYTPSVVESTAADYVLSKMRKEYIMRRGLLPPIQLNNSDLDRDVSDPRPCVIVEDSLLDWLDMMISDLGPKLAALCKLRDSLVGTKNGSGSSTAAPGPKRGRPSTKSLITDYLRTHANATVAEIARAVGRASHLVSNTLYNHKHDFVGRRREGRVRWALRY